MVPPLRAVVPGRRGAAGQRGIEVDHVSVYRWVQRFTPLFAEAARPSRHCVGDRWCVDETHVKVAGSWRYLYRAVDQFGQVVDVYFSVRAIAGTQVEPKEIVTDRARAYPRVLDDLVPGTRHDVEQYANNPIEADHGRLKARLRPMRGLKTAASTRRISLGHALVQNLCRGHYELGVEVPANQRVAAAFAELARVI